MPATTLTFDQLHERALARAVKERLPVMALSASLFHVPSRSRAGDAWRSVHMLESGALTCDCEGHRAYGCCTHVASVELALATRLPLYRLPAGTALPAVPPDPAEAARQCPRCRREPRRHETGLCRTCEIDALYGG